MEADVHDQTSLGVSKGQKIGTSEKGRGPVAPEGSCVGQIEVK